MKGLNNILLLIFCSFLFFQCEPSQSKFVKEGKTTKAKLAFKLEKETASSVDYTFMVYFFTNDTLKSHNFHESDLWKDSSLSMSDKIEKWNTRTKQIGDFYSAEIIVDYDTYDAHKEDDVLEILYLPSDPHKAMLKENIKK